MWSAPRRDPSTWRWAARRPDLSPAVKRGCVGSCRGRSGFRSRATGACACRTGGWGCGGPAPAGRCTTRRSRARWCSTGRRRSVATTSSPRCRISNRCTWWWTRPAGRAGAGGVLSSHRVSDCHVLRCLHTVGRRPAQSAG